MNSQMNTQTKQTFIEMIPPLPVIAALLATYLVWSSTYLVTRITIESIPPFMLTGMRSFVAGSLLLGFGLMRGNKQPTRQQIINALFVGSLLFGGGAGLVAFSEIWVESGLTALAVAATPLWAAIFAAAFFGQWPSRMEWLGLFVGMAGIFLLNMENGMRGNPIGAAALIAGPMLWALGSMWSRRVSMPQGAVSTGYQLLGGALALVFISFFTGESMTHFPTNTAILGFIYLTFLSSVLTFSAYMYLVNNTRPVIATSYAYVNPILAVLLGVTLAEETITSVGIMAMFVILAGLLLLAIGKQQKKQAPIPV